MAGGLTNYARDIVLKSIANGLVFVPPTNLYLALFNSSPTPAVTGTEVIAPSYGRVSIMLTNVANLTTSLMVDAIYGMATESWGTVGWWVLYDAPTGGNPWYYGTFDASKAINNGDQARVIAGQLTLGL